MKPATHSPVPMTTPEAIIGISLKMYFGPERTLQWSAEVADLARTHPAVVDGRVMLIVLPSVPVLQAVIKVFADTPVKVGAQDLFWEDRGPYTGAVSGTDLKDLGCEYAEIGHVERRQLFGEDDRIVNLKVAAALRNGLIPLLCIGEHDPGSVGRAAADCIDQLDAALSGLDAPTDRVPLLVAYEPAWAIGAHEPASADHIIGVVQLLRVWIDARRQWAGAGLIYGGSASEGVLSSLRGAAGGLFLGRFAHDALALKAILDETLRLT